MMRGMGMGEAPEPFISIRDDVIRIRRSWDGHHNGRMLAWVLDVDEGELSYSRDGMHGWFTVARDKVDLDWLAQRVKELFLQVETRCSHSGPDCVIHNVDTRWRQEEARKEFDF
jgi:hypothetical protein